MSLGGMNARTRVAILKVLVVEDIICIRLEARGALAKLEKRNVNEHVASPCTCALLS